MMPDLATPRAIFFDLDETLIDNTVGFEALITDVFTEYFPELVGHPNKIAPAFGALRSSAGLYWQTMFGCKDEGKNALNEIFFDALQNSKLNTAHSDAMAEHFMQQASAGTQLKAGVTQLLMALKETNIATGIITNGIEGMQRRKIVHHGLDNLVDAIIVSERAGAHKPDPLVFEFALANLDIVAADAWHIGDHPLNDVSGAINCGITGILFAPLNNHLDNYQVEASLLRKPDYTVRDFAQLTALIESASDDHARPI